MRRIIVVSILLAVLAAGTLVTAGMWAVSRFEAPGPLVERTIIIVPAGSSLEEIARILADKGAIANRRLFVLGVMVFGRGHPLKAGEYAIPASQSPRGVMEILQSGKTVVHKLTVAEGLTSRQVMAEIAAADGLQGAAPAPPPEGAMLPETYHYSYGDTRAAMVARMRKAMDETLAVLWAHRQANLPLATPQQALILASIVEKETGRAGERPHVAAVFLNRLRKGMRLQSDPTVVYALTKGAGPLGRPLTREDLETQSPYNTYVIDGLPPGPIANPGTQSIRAVMQPAQSDDLYFVADGAGGHVFARTLKEHDRNVAKLRKIERQHEKAAGDPPRLSPSVGNGKKQNP